MSTDGIKCVVCEHRELATENERERTVCDPCASKLGIVALPRATRPPGPCQRCEQRSFIRAIPRELTVKATSGTAGNTNPPEHAPMFVTYAIATEARLFRAGNSVGDIHPYLGRGPLEMYVCRTCGFVEWYCITPGQLPIGPQYMTEVIEYEAPVEEPYR